VGYTIIRCDGGDELHLLKDRQEEPLPEGQEDHRLYCEELQDRVIGSQEVFGGKVEEEKSVEGKRDADVVDDADIDIAVFWGPVAIMVDSTILKENHDDGHEGLDDAELESSLFTEPEKSDVVGLSGETEGSGHPARLDRFSSDLRHDVALPTKVLITQAEKVVDDEALIAVPDSVEVDIVVVVAEEEEA